MLALPPGDKVTLGDIVASGQLPELRWPDFSDYKPELTEFYQSTGYSSAWVHDRQRSPQALVMIEAFKNAWRKGLDPEDYEASRWDGRLGALKDSGIDPARFDATVTVCTMRFVSDLHIGRIHPKHLNFGLSIESKKYDLAQFPARPALDCYQSVRGVGRRGTSICRISSQPDCVGSVYGIGPYR
jgi:hypothetical protein